LTLAADPMSVSDAAAAGAGWIADDLCLVRTTGLRQTSGMTPREVMTDYLAAAKCGDWQTAFGFFAEDIVLHVPGRSALAGDLYGKAAAVNYIQAIRDHYRDGAIELELIDMLVSDDRVALLVREAFHGDGPPTEIRRANVYRIQGDEIVDISIFEHDQYLVDALLRDVDPG
jgi:ketosteroid isomerase-like protein